ncbi:DUF6044 family protein [Hymenobacter tibetensis]|uniref:DUF6044 family protein n=1 Tax=Hymenobacter tibetensis TaxID=497967 RepID=A0ABY4D5X5_9BACT|nr:DUF6044 family protein [Hymenobacter tibetensis]UOG76616.1 DUF6044 family protein [Hymenobacter tibetensis]
MRVSPLVLALVGLLLFLTPFLVLQEQSYVTIDDNLEAEFAIPYLLVQQGVALDQHPAVELPAVMNGLPRNAARSGLSVTVGLFELLPPWGVYLLQQALVRLLGLLGMYALLRRHWLSGPHHKFTAAALALCWATLPLYSMYGVSVLGQAGLLLAFLELRQGTRRWWPWLIVAAFPFWTIFAFVGPFVLTALGVLTLYDWRRTGRLPVRLVAGVLLLLGAYLVVEWPLFNSILIAKQFVPHRLEFDMRQITPMGLGAGLRSAGQFFFMGQYHASRFLRLAGLLAVGVVLLRTPAGQRLTQLWRFGWWLLVLLGLAVFSGFYPQMVAVVQPKFPALGAFNFGRFHYLTPLLWFVVLALALRQLPGRWQAGLLGVQLLVGVSMNPEWLNNLRELAGRPNPHEPNYAAYVAQPLFKDVEQTIRQQTGLRPAQYRVACLGFPPAVAQLNNFYTLDSYQNNYPLPYKHAFRPLIAGELAKSPVLRTYFDAWGNRCFLFSAELGKDFRVGAFQHRVVQDFTFDTSTFRKLTGRYVLSAARLARPARSGLRPVGVFSRPDAYWRIYLYEVIQ